MTSRQSALRLPTASGLPLRFSTRNRLRVPAALLDALCLSALLWLAVLAMLG